MIGQESEQMKIGRFALTAFVFLLPLAAYGNLILHYFYDVGLFFFDAGWAAYLIRDAGPLLHDPRFTIAPGAESHSWFVFHISPIFLATSALAQLLPLSRIQFYALYIGVSHALPGLAVFWLLVSGYRMRRPAALAVAALLALLFAFDGMALAIARFPHFTMLIVGTGMMFLAALVLQRLRIAAFFFILCIAIREDAALHLFAMLALLVALDRWRGVPWSECKPSLAFAAVALLYGIAVLALQHTLFPGHSLLVSEYLGSPMFADVTLSSVALRLAGWIVYRSYVFLPALLACAWSIRSRNPYIVIGYAAFVPWGLLHLVAAREMVNSLPSYYAYPFMIASFWPLVGILHQRRRSAGSETSLIEPIAGFALLTALSFIPTQNVHNPGRMAFPESFLSLPSLAREAATDRALHTLAGAAELGATLVDQSVAALVPELYLPDNSLSQSYWQHPSNSLSQSWQHPDTIIYFDQGYEASLARQRAATAGLDRVYAVPGTEIRVATNRRLDGVLGLVRAGAPD
jgi:hypothetical protein